MKTEYKLIGLSIILGLSFWVIDALFDYFFFYGRSFLGLLIFDVPNHEVYIRLVIFLCFLIFGIFISRAFAKRKKAEQEIEVLSRFPSENPNPVLRIATDGVVLYTNDAGKRVFKAEVGKKMPERYFSILKKVIASQQSMSLEEQVGDQYFSTMVKSIPKAGYLNMYSMDITERKKVEEKIHAYQKRLRSLASELTLTEEREKRHLATELQDSIGQLLALCRIKLGELEKATKATDVRSLVEEVEKGLEEIIWHTRSLTLRLGPPLLYELGLEAALEWLVEYMEEQYGIQTKFRFDGKVDPIEEELRVFLFRAAQELMMNIAKHAKTDRAKISACRKNGSIRLTVEDAGVGFNTAYLESPSIKDGEFGLFSIREHIKYFGGEFSLESKPRKSTQVSLVVPLKGPQKRSQGR